MFHPKSFSKPTEISSGVYSTGAVSTFVKQQSLVVNTEKGNLVITGRAHPGLENMIERSREIGEIYGAPGGFYGFSKLGKLQGIRLIAPCHCSQHKQQIRQSYPGEFEAIRAGSVLEI